MNGPPQKGNEAVPAPAARPPRCHSMKGPPTAVLLDSQSVQPDVILLLDSFFEVCIHHGEAAGPPVLTPFVPPPNGGWKGRGEG